MNLFHRLNLFLIRLPLLPFMVMYFVVGDREDARGVTWSATFRELGPVLTFPAVFVAWLLTGVLFPFLFFMICAQFVTNSSIKRFFFGDYEL